MFNINKLIGVPAACPFGFDTATVRSYLLSTIFKTVVPILYPQDVAASIAYYTDVPGFQNQWTVGDPPDFGSVAERLPNSPGTSA
ncbi:hypothetical protein [Puia sp.]|uniref:hypothetical protein n=1 Tax=Puia sp. TaxID=2045100 RepID=UPI002D7F190B|nr:hypothetical protein [Puia sp.]